MWTTPNKSEEGRGWIGIFNRDENSSNEIVLSLDDLGLSSADFEFHNVWDNGDFRIGEAIRIGANDVIFLEYKEC